MSEEIHPIIEVIADYPESEYAIGTIIEFPTKEVWFSGELEWVSEWIRDKDGGASGSRPLSYFTPYPLIFRRIQ